MTVVMEIGKEELCVCMKTNLILINNAEILQKEGKTVIYVSKDDQSPDYLALLDAP